MGILSTLLGQLTGFGLGYLNDYLQQNRLQDAMRQSTDYYTNEFIPAASKATTMQEQQVAGQAPPGAASLLGFTRAPIVREPGGPEAMQFGQAVQLNAPPAPKEITPQLQSAMMNVGTQFLGNPPAIAASMAKGQEEKQRIISQRITQAHSILDPFMQYMDPDQVSSNIDLYSKTGAVPFLLRGAPKDMQQQIIKLAGEKSYATGYGGAAGRGAYEYSPTAVSGEAARASARRGAELGTQYQFEETHGLPHKGEGEGKVPMGASSAIRKEIFAGNPELYTPTADPEDPTQMKQVLVPNETAQQIETLANEIFANDPRQDVYKAVTQAKIRILKGKKSSGSMINKGALQEGGWLNK